MPAAVKIFKVEYQSKSNTTGLTDVKAQVYFNGVPKAVGASAIVLTEVDSTNSPGLYELTISAATLVGYGVAAGQANTVSGYINSATKPASAPFRQLITVANEDDVYGILGTPAGASVSADIAAVKSDTAAIKVDLETGTSSLATILAAVNSIKNNAGFAVPVPAEMIIPSSGSNAYLIPVTVYNEANTLIDPDSNTITVALANQAGTSRASYLSATTMTRVSTGQYTVTTTIPSTAPEEQLLFSFSYSINTLATVRKATTDVVTDINAAGLALQSTLLATQTTVNAINTLTTDPTNGLAAIKTAVTAVGTQVTNLQTDITNNVEGTGFSSSTDSLHQLSLAIANIGIGGRAV